MEKIIIGFVLSPGFPVVSLFFVLVDFFERFSNNLRLLSREIERPKDWVI
jgi:hypothetical protein